MKHILSFFVCLLLLVLPRQADALAGEWQRDEAVDVRLISGVDAVGQDKTVPLGLEVRLGEGWHTYWRSPGAAGLPPQIDWKDSKSEQGNLQDATLLYPAPHRYSAYGLDTVGYYDHVVFPIDAQVRRTDHALALTANLDLLVCSAICVPKTFPLELVIPAGVATQSAEAPLIKAFRDQLPGDVRQSGFLLKSVANTGDGLTIRFESANLLQDPDIFIEDDKNIGFTAPVTKVSAGGYAVSFTVKPADTLPEGVQLTGMKLTLTVVNGDHALEQIITVPPATEAAAMQTASSLPLSIAILFAILGGFILNMMPCVLPVLSLKILNLVGHGGAHASVVRRSFLMTAAGILFSFLVLAALTILLKEFGLTLGWGVQFQQPLFLVCLILLLTFFAANMWGLFEIRLPSWLADNLSKTTYHPKLAGDFAIGAFATLLATPCTAPFLGTAVGFALASGPRDILVIFVALGFGMILPYLTIAFFPRFATSLPKPGKWMATLRHVLGVALASTAFWLTWVLSAQITARFAALVGLFMTGILLLLCLRKANASLKLLRRGMIIFALAAFGATLGGSILPKPPAQTDLLWTPFDERAIEADLQEGKTVFVDVTADWCLTCKANKKFVLSQGDIAQRLFHSDIITMQADWTNPDPAITAFLHKYGRYGIPFNVVFGPGAPQGMVLPELLTPASVTKALDQASARTD